MVSSNAHSSLRSGGAVPLIRCRHAACATSHAVKSSQSTSVSGATSALRAILILSSSCTPGSSCRLRMLRREWPLSIRGSSATLPSLHRRGALGSTLPPPSPPPPPLLLLPLPGVVSRLNATSTQVQFMCVRSHSKRSSRTTAPTSLAAASASSAELPASWARVRLPVATSKCKCSAGPPSVPHSAIPSSPNTVSPTASVCPPHTRGQRGACACALIQPAHTYRKSRRDLDKQRVD